jgi:hypothetical protein
VRGVDLRWQDAWGYHDNEKFIKKAQDNLTWNSPVNQKRVKEKFGPWIHIKNGANAVGYLLSPIVGIIRIAVAGFFLYKLRNADILSLSDIKLHLPDEGVEKQLQFFWMEIGRGGLEFFCLGIFLAPIDIIATVVRYYYPPSSEIYSE